MCKHEVVLTASRNAVVSLRGNPLKHKWSGLVEISRRENYYDWCLQAIESKGCSWCERDDRLVKAWSQRTLDLTFEETRQLIAGFASDFLKEIADKADSWGN